MMKCNYHTHTARCHHAVGEDEDYVRAALTGGFEELGFSDHMPWPFPSYVSRCRMTVGELPGYMASVTGLKEKYADRLTIRLGMESEYYPRYADHMHRLLDQGIEYYILGQHFNSSEEDNPYVPEECKTDAGILRYAENVVNAVRTGMFRYVAHPDLYMANRPYAEFNKAAEEAAVMICQACAEADIPLEFNLLGWDTGRGYPCDLFWNFAREYGNRVIFGVDAHDPAYLANTDLWDRAHAHIAELGLPVQESLKF